MSPRIVRLEEAAGLPVGGKARGLAELQAIGLTVPAAFVVLDAREGDYPADLEAVYHALGDGPVAVRSSALDEDGTEASFAGQYDTVLNVRGLTALKAAINQCVRSLEAEHARTYRDEQADTGDVHMSVVVQRMIEPRVAGVLFTADPVSARRDRCVIDAVAGLGEKLVSGEVTPDHYQVDARGTVRQQHLAGSTPLLGAADIQALLADARQARAALGQELDMEWAIDADGRPHWLQARPITTLPADLNEFDTPLGSERDVLTRCNIGEMMPGAVSPLTISVTGWGIEHGMQHMQVSYGAIKRIEPVQKHIMSGFGHFFINLSANTVSAARIAGVDIKQMGLAICGREVPELEVPPRAPFFVRLWNFGKMLRYVITIPRVIAAFETERARFSIPAADTAREQLAAIDERFDFYLHTYDVHMQSSAGSGFTEGVLQRMISDGTEATPEEQAEAARLLQGAEGVESAILVEMLDDVVDAIARHPDAVEAFQTAEPAAALAWLDSEAAGEARELYRAFLARHGHRGYRELSMREPCWADAPLPLIQTMQASVAARFRTDVAAGRQAHAPLDWSRLNRGLRWFLPKAHAAVRRREQTKSHLAWVTNEFKRAYRRVGKLLEREGALPDADLVFFFSRAELGGFVDRPDATAVARARSRREALVYQAKLEFPEIFVGRPEPVTLSAAGLAEDGVLPGRPVSAGVVEGVARVARDITEAAALQPGEILIAPITDVGWTPYFSLIAGLATDVGSAVSHGCVIAREYGLPAVVNLRSATRDFRTGDRVRLDGDHGTLTLLERPETTHED